MKPILFKYMESEPAIPMVAFEVTQEVMDGKVELPDGLKSPVNVFGVMMIYDKWGEEHEVKVGSWMYRDSSGDWCSAYRTGWFLGKYRLLGQCNEQGIIIDQEPIDG